MSFKLFKRFKPLSSFSVKLAATVIRNLLTFTEEFNNAAWIKAGLTVTANTTAAPDGSVTADTVTVNGAGQGLYQTVTVVPGTQYTFTWYVLLGTMPQANFKFALYNATTSVFIAQNIIPSVLPTSSEWTRLTHTFTVPAGCTSIRIHPFRNGVSTTGTVFFWGAQIEVGATATAYQRVGT